MTTAATDLMFIESTMPTFDAMIAEHVMGGRRPRNYLSVGANAA